MSRNLDGDARIGRHRGRRRMAEIWRGRQTAGAARLPTEPNYGSMLA